MLTVKTGQNYKMVTFAVLSRAGKRHNFGQKFCSSLISSLSGIEPLHLFDTLYNLASGKRKKGGGVQIKRTLR